jgi:uncharacterized protein YcbX
MSSETAFEAGSFILNFRVKEGLKMHCKIKKIWIYPIKSLDGIRISQTGLNADGSLINDRVFALHRKDGNILNGKRDARIHEVRMTIDPSLTRIHLSHTTSKHSGSFELATGQNEISEWFSDLLKEPITLRHSRSNYADDKKNPGATVIGSGTLKEIASWYTGLAPEQMHRRLRMNLVLDLPEAFAEDRMLGKYLYCGDIKLALANLCRRCVVPSRDPLTGQAEAQFMKTFIHQRQQYLNDKLKAAMDGNPYRAGINTVARKIPAGATLKTGADVRLSE